jgi:hypothetical protein
MIFIMVEKIMATETAVEMEMEMVVAMEMVTATAMGEMKAERSPFVTYLQATPQIHTP